MKVLLESYECKTTATYASAAGASCNSPVALCLSTSLNKASSHALATSTTALMTSLGFNTLALKLTPSASSAPVFVKRQALSAVLALEWLERRHQTCCQVVVTSLSLAG